MISSITPRWMRWALLASLCLNVLLAAFLGTRWVEIERRPILPGGPPQLVERVASRLPAADAELVRRAYRRKQAEFDAGQAAYDRTLLAAGLRLVEPRVDPEALRTAVMAAREARIRIGDLAIETFLEVLPQLSAEGRRALMAGMRRR